MVILGILGIIVSLSVCKAIRINQYEKNDLIYRNEKLISCFNCRKKIAIDKNTDSYTCPYCKKSKNN